MSGKELFFAEYLLKGFWDKMLKATLDLLSEDSIFKEQVSVIYLGNFSEIHYLVLSYYINFYF